MYPTKKLIKDTQRLIRLKIFLEREIGLRKDLSAEELRKLLTLNKS